MYDLFRYALAGFGTVWSRHQALKVFDRLSDWELQDIGLERNALEEHVRHAYPWPQLEGKASTAVLRTSVQGCG